MSDWYSRAKKGLQGIYDDTYESMSDIQRQRETGDISYTESSVRQLGEVAGGVGSLVDAGLSVIPGYEKLQETIGEGVESFLETDVGQQFARYPQQRPRVSGMLGALANIAEFVPGIKGVSTVRNAASDVNMLTGPESGKGMELASLDNYIDNFYGIKEVNPTSPAASMEGATKPFTDKQRQMEQRFYDPKSVTNRALDFVDNIPGLKKGPQKFRALTRSDRLKPEESFESTKETRTAIAKLDALQNFGVESVKNTVRDYFSPESRALFREQGLSRTGRDIIASHLIDSKLKDDKSKKILDNIEELQKKYRDEKKEGNRLTDKHREITEQIQEEASKLTSREVPKAVAEAIYQLHIGQQGGRKGGLNAGLINIAKESFLEPYSKYDTGTLSSWFTKNHRATSDKYDVSFNQDDASTIENIILNANKNGLGETGVPALVVMKEPSKKLSSGNHIFDVFNKRSKAGSTPPAGKIANAFENLGNKEVSIGQLYDELKKEKLNIKKVTEDKIYFTGSTTGSAIVEGGVNVSGFVKPDGTTAFVMADVHDFFENIRPVKKFTDKIAPHSLMAVSPPLFKNFLEDGKISNKQPKKEKKDIVDVTGALEEIAAAKPRSDILQAEQRRQQGMLLSGLGQPAATMVGNIEEEEAR